MTAKAAAQLAPIAVFLYKRPRHTARLIDTLLANDSFAGSPLFVYCDGPRGSYDEPAVEQTRRLARERLAPHGELIERTANVGLAASIIGGVTELCARYGRVIVLEDDLVLHPGCVTFLNAALERYADESCVYHINAYRYPIGDFTGLCFSRLPSSWGWATWERAWRSFEPDASKLEERIRGANLASVMDFDGAAAYYELLQHQVAGRVDSWAIRWYASVLLERGLALYPDVSQVVNSGMDRSGVHCDVTSTFDVALGTASLNWPRVLAEDMLFYESMRAFLRVSKGTFANRVARRLKRMLSVIHPGEKIGD
jgi:hypothetical protein